VANHPFFYLREIYFRTSFLKKLEIEPHPPKTKAVLAG